MIRSLDIENLKGIAGRQRIDFAPLTLLFGANSAGKSTILQALLYLYELIERGGADVDRTELGGHVLELGGFARLVHKHDIERAIVLRAEFETPGGLERFGRDLADFPFPDLDDDVESAWLELTMRFRRSAAYRGPVVESAVIGINADRTPLVWLELGATLRDAEPLRACVNMNHPVLKTEEYLGISDAWAAISYPQETLPQGIDEEAFDAAGYLPLFFAVSRGRLSALPAPGDALRVIPVGDATPEATAAAQQVRTFLEMVVLGTTAQLASFLRDSPYIGPLRTIPPRGFLFERAGRIASWADGLAAWDLLLADRLTLVERTNTWLRRLQAGCQVVVQELGDGRATAEERAEGHVDKTVRRLLLDTGAGSYVLPSEVGAGISQLIPVVVAAIAGRGGLALVEQPEIHVHPAVQVGLGDLLIEGVAGEGRRRILVVETHSEHLILRLLRRIRETTDGSRADGEPAFTREKLSVLYVESTLGGVRVTQLGVDDRGEFVDPWPKGFFDERFAEVYGP